MMRSSPTEGSGPDRMSSVTCYKPLDDHSEGLYGKGAVRRDSLASRSVSRPNLKWMTAVGLIIVLVSACLASLSDDASQTTDSAMDLPSRASTVMPSEVIDSEGTVGRHSSIAVDSNDKVHISYWDYTNRDLKYATNASGSWVTTAIDTEGDVGSHSSIAIDSNDKVHISYHNATIDPLYEESQGDLKYATDASGTWVTTTVDLGSGVTKGLETSIAIDSADRIHISYRISVTLSGSNLKYATNASGAWETFVIDQENRGGQFSSIGVDSNDNVHISYYCEELFHNDLKYATDASGSWVASTIDHAYQTVLGYYTSLAVDSSDKIHISYYNSTGSNLKYATDASGSWAMETLDSAGVVGKYTSIAVDSNDRIHISYHDETNTALKYVTDASGSWVDETIDDDGAVGWETSIAVDSSDSLHISYYDGTNSDLKYIMITNPPEVIPEFSDVLVPIVAIALMVVIAGRFRTRAKDS